MPYRRSVDGRFCHRARLRHAWTWRNTPCTHTVLPFSFVLSTFSWPATFFTKRYPPPRSLLDLNLFHFVSLTTRSHRPPLPSSSSVCQLFNVARGGGVNAWPISRLDNGPRCRTSFSIARSLIHLDDEALREISNDIFPILFFYLLDIYPISIFQIHWRILR